MCSGASSMIPQPNTRNYVTLGFNNKRHRIKSRNDWTRTVQKLYIDATGSRTIGYMITPKGVANVLKNVRYDVHGVSYLLGADEEQKIRRDFRKNGFYCSTEGALDQQYYIPYTLLTAESTALKVDDGATKANIRNAFRKGMGNQKQTRKILQDIATMVS
jgi:hypothetical protein